MACLGAVLYDPASIATGTLSALKAMTAMDTTNARITFTAPANGKVLVKIRAACKGSTIAGAYLFGVLDGSTVRGRRPVHGVSQRRSRSGKGNGPSFSSQA